MLGLSKLGWRTAMPTARLFQFGGVEGFTAIVALVATRAGILAMRARSLNVTVGQETFSFRAVGLRRAVFIYIPIFTQSEEHILRFFGVVRRAG